ncbi:hypothetical protein GCM10009691_40400 [Brevibacterium picturae]|uniref:Secreted protein n=1 Tax=Brevibacterium picturae TaxID=260553 RepID=A0ABN2CQT7_9MICO
MLMVISRSLSAGWSAALAEAVVTLNTSREVAHSELPGHQADEDSPHRKVSRVALCPPRCRVERCRAARG